MFVTSMCLYVAGVNTSGHGSTGWGLIPAQVIRGQFTQLFTFPLGWSENAYLSKANSGMTLDVSFTLHPGLNWQDEDKQWGHTS